MLKTVLLVLPLFFLGGCLSVSGSLRLGDTAKIAELKKPVIPGYGEDSDMLYEEYVKFGIKKPEIYRMAPSEEW